LFGTAPEAGLNVLGLEQTVGAHLELDKRGQGGGPLVRDGVLDGGRLDGDQEVLLEGHLEVVGAQRDHQVGFSDHQVVLLHGDSLQAHLVVVQYQEVLEVDLESCGQLADVCQVVLLVVGQI